MTATTPRFAHFDFTSYLCTALSIPTHTITITPLTGGGMNITVRAVFEPPALLFPANGTVSTASPIVLTTLVLKHAPPFVVNDPTMACSPYRQTIEARALAFLAGEPIAQLKFDSVDGQHVLQVPRLLHHDAVADVLWMSDLGADSTVMQGWLLLPGTTPAHAAMAGKQVGLFLSTLWKNTGAPSAEVCSWFTNPYNRADEIMPRNAATVARCLGEIGLDAAEIEELVRRYREAFEDAEDEEACLGMRDLWMGSVLVDAEGVASLCDWEMFGRSSASEELGMLLGCTRGLMLAPSTAESARVAAKAFVDACLAVFVEEAGEMCTPRFKRRLILCFVRELGCMEDELEGEARLYMIRALSSMLRAAGSGVEDMKLELIEPEERQFMQAVL
jgi:hypothetical protein